MGGGTLDMKNNSEARVPAFYKVRAKVEFKTARLGGLWHVINVVSPKFISNNPRTPVFGLLSARASTLIRGSW